MPGVARIEDVCTGHSCWPPRNNDQGSPDTIANNRSVHRQSDHWVSHCCGDCHDSILASGSPNVIVNNLQAGRCGDPVACGSSVATCSNDVIIN